MFSQVSCFLMHSPSCYVYLLTEAGVNGFSGDSSENRFFCCFAKRLIFPHFHEVNLLISAFMALFFLHHCFHDSDYSWDQQYSSPKPGFISGGCPLLGGDADQKVSLCKRHANCELKGN